ncbi:MAG: hypothetical protein K6T83_06095 [Alicyclobacillus sp.]|nr:hypothetical protein [Alicyclobacillus sp.]
MKTNEELQEYATEILARARLSSSSLRLLGGVAIRRLYPDKARRPALDRTCKDLDFAVSRRDARGLTEVFAQCGFEADRQFNALHGATRLLYTAGDLQADVFISEFAQCHKLELEPRLYILDETLPPADLLLMKLQVVEINEKDLKDLCVIFLGAKLGSVDSSTEINTNYLTGLTSQDWGWYTTCKDTLNKLADYVSARISNRERDEILEKIRDLEKKMDERPKSMKWKMRSKVGRRMPWYQLPEEARR